MVQFKKICCLILTVLLLFAVGALCALGVKADDDLIYYLGRGYNANSVTTKASSSSLPISTPLQTVSNNNICFGVSYIDPSSTSASFSFDPGARFDSSRSLTVTLTSNLSLSSYNLYPGVTGWRLDVFYTVIDSSYSGITWFLLNNCYTGTQFSTVSTFTSCSITSPRPDDTEYNPVELGLHFSNYRLTNGSYSQLNHAFDPPEALQDVSLSTSTDGFVLYGGAFIENFSEILTNNVVLQGELSFLLIDNTGQGLNPYASFTPYFVNGSDPSLNGFVKVGVPSSWETQNRVITNKGFLHGTLFTITFYIVVSNDFTSDLGMTPTNLVFELEYNQTGFSNSFSYALLGYNLNYYYRSSMSSDLPSNPNSGLLSGLGSDGSTILGQNPNEFNSEYANELAYLQSVYGVQDKIVAKSIEQIEAEFNNTFEYDNFMRTLDLLSSSMSYSGTNFYFELPSAQIPWFGSQSSLTLWSNHEIPFKSYVDSLPHQYFVIISFIVLFSGVSVFFGGLGIYMSSLFRGNVKAL